MGLFDRVEQRLERAVNGVFARAFKSEVEPLEIASAIRRAMDDRATLLGRGRTIVPNLFTIELSQTDYDRLCEYERELEGELVAAAQEHAESQRYQPGGPVRVVLESDAVLETGVFRVRPSTARRTGETSSSDLRPGTHRDGSWVPPDGGRPAGPVSASGAAGTAGPAPAAAEPAGRHTDDDLEATAVHAPVPAAPRRVNPADRPWLDVDGERYPLMGPLTVLGRDDSADIVLDDPGISRRHSEIRVTNDGPHLVASIRDLGSTNGTFVNSERISSARLADGDRITAGRTSVTYRGGRR